VALRQQCRAEHPDWWNAPVPSFGDRDAWLAIVGLAPGKHGANRTGRPFTGDYARVILADEISPDGCRLWDIKSNEKLDKDRFRLGLGGEAEAYQEIARRLGLLEADEPNSVLDLETHRKKRGK
jgi:hypothetical protein